MFGRVTHTLDAAAMRVHFLFYLIHILKHLKSLFFDAIICVSLIEVLLYNVNVNATTIEYSYTLLTQNS